MLYKISKIIVIITLIVMAICFLLMGFGIDASVFPFFVAAAVGTVFYLICRSVRLRFERAERECTEPEPPFYGVYCFFYDLNEKIKATDKVVIVSRICCVVVSAALIVSLLFLWHNWTIKVGRPKDPEYNDCLLDYPIVEAEMNEALAAGDEKKAESDRRVLTRYDNLIEYIETTVAEATAKVPVFTASSIVLGAADTAVIVWAAAVGIRQKRKRGKAS